jgi:hypothetical protein
MRPVAAALAGAGAALGMSLVVWPVYVLVANLAVARDDGVPGAAAELLWGLALGAMAGVAAARISGLASQSVWPLSAFGSWLIWTFVLALMAGLGAVPPVFVTTSMLVALGTTAVIARRLRPRAAPGLARALLAGVGGFAVFVTALVLALVPAASSRPSGVGFAEWRRYMDRVDTLGFIAVALGAGAALALALAILSSERRTLGVLISFVAFGVLFLAAAPFLGFLSSCYAGEVLRIFGWLVSPSC